MRLEDVTAEIRPRSDWEAVDLGIALVRRDFWRLAGVWLLAMSPLILLGIWWRAHPLWWLFVWWWCKPAGARLVLHDLSRSLFGERTGAGGLARRAAWAWCGRGWVWLLLARFSMRRPLVMPVADLEGLRGEALRERVRVVRRRGDGAVFGLSLAGLFLQGWLGLALFAMAVVLVPEAQAARWNEAFGMWTEGEAVIPPLLLGWTFALCLAPAMSVVEIFVTGAGFGLYLNNRSWIEGWDIELAFKRLAERLRGAGMAAVLVAAVALVLAQGRARGDDGGREAERAVLAEVLESEEFRVHSKTEQVWEPRETGNIADWLGKFVPEWFPGFRAAAGQVLLGVVLVSAAAALAWLLHRHRNLLGRAAPRGDMSARGGVSVLPCGLDPASASEPGDPALAAIEWWREGRRREAMAMLYRAAIVWFMEERQLEIGPAATEEDCVRRVRGGAAGVEAEHFGRLAGAWIRLAYGGRPIGDDEVAQLCASWPYRRKGAEP